MPAARNSPGWFGRLKSWLTNAHDEIPSPHTEGTEPERPPVVMPTNEELVAARDLLCSRGVFDGWIVGYAASPTDELIAFALLLRHSSAKQTASYLLEHGASGGIAYGLCLYYLIDHSVFLQVLPAYKDRQDAIQIAANGCLPLTTPSTLAAVVEEIESGHYPNLLKEWCASKCP